MKINLLCVVLLFLNVLFSFGQNPLTDPDWNLSEEVIFSEESVKGEMPEGFACQGYAMATGVLNIPEITTPEFSMGVLYPDKTTTVLTIAFSLDETSRVSAGIFNGNGRQIMEVFEGELHDGAYHLETNITNLCAGEYLVRLTIGSASGSRKFRVGKQ